MRISYWSSDVCSSDLCDLRNTLRGAPFIVMVVLGLLLTFTVIKFRGLIYGTKTLPVTAQMPDMIGRGMSLFLLTIVTFYAGELAWRGPSLRVAAAPHAYAPPDGVPRAATRTAHGT